MAVNKPHVHTPEEERRIREAALDETVESSFPASDPPSTLPNPDDDEALDSHEPPQKQARAICLGGFCLGGSLESSGDVRTCERPVIVDRPF